MMMDGRIFFLLCFIAIAQHPVAVVGNLPPTFIKDMNLEAIAEDTPIGTSIYRLEGKDPEEGPVTFELTGTENLVIDSVTGIVTVAKSLDHETKQTLRFSVSIEDNVGNGQQNNKVTLPVSVLILDVNDNSPVFANEPYDVVVPEDIPVEAIIFEKINMTDVDVVGGNLSVQCLVQPMFPSTCDMFSVQTNEVTNSQLTAALILKQKLDYETSSFHQIVLIGSDGKHNVTTTVTVRLKDVPNKPPVFIGSLFGNINESLPTGTTVMMIKAKDGDKTEHRNITYDITSNPGGYFDINHLTGELQVINKIDRESLQSSVITLKIRARENVNGAPQDDITTSSITDVYVTVHDINDEPPKFNRETTTVRLSENQPKGTPLPNLNLFVFDPDISIKSELALTLSDHSGYFRLEQPQINGSGVINIYTKNEPLDHENPNHRTFILLVTAKETNTAERLSSTATVIVTVDDENDNAPHFGRESYVASVIESAPPGTFITKINATDIDGEHYGLDSIRYSLFGEGSNQFNVDNITGVVSVASSSSLDFEIQTSYYLSYEARDAGGSGLLSVVPLRIDLMDADDNPPEFLRDQYSGIINEGDVQFTPRLIIEALDKDESSTLRYEIVDGIVNNSFQIDPSTGELRSSNSSGVSLGLPGSGRFNLTIKATDSGQNSALTTASVTIQDINNNVPIFDQKLYQGNISETSQPGTVITRVSATDSDSQDNGLVKYRVSRGARDNFIINETSGIMTVATDAKLDYDIRPEYTIEIVAVDQGTPPRTATATIVVTVTDSNNKPPIFTPKIQQTQVFEDAKIGQIVYTLNVTDPDATSANGLKYQTLNRTKVIDEMGKEMESNINAFEVDEDSGEVRVLRELRREKQAEVTMTVAVVDTSANPQQTGTGTLIISIITINDAAPVFPAPWSTTNPNIFINVLEEQPTGSIVYTFVAIDADSNIAGYAIVPEDPYFDIDIVSGVVTTRSRIDYEAIQKHEFVVVAFDTGVPQLSATALVTATINNVNDNDPMFNQSEYTMTITENSMPDTYVTTVLAEDKDLGDFGRVVYSLIGNNNEVFRIDNNGVISVKNQSALDRELNPVFAIHVVAVDTAPAEMSRKSVPTPVYINLLDVNDNVPKFTQKVYSTSVMDSILVFPPTPILQLTANDDDEGIHALVKYKITSGNEAGTFLLNSRTGVLFPAASLAGKPKRHVLKVESRDMNGTSDNYDEAKVIIQVQEVNINAPKMVKPTMKNLTMHILENETPENNILWTIHAEDPDPGENGRIHYFIKDQERDLVETAHFSINPENGQLKLNEPLDREIKSKYTIVVVARDDGVPQPFETLQELLLVVDDINDNEPQFPRTMFTNPYTFKVDENLPVGSFVGQVDAFDLDFRLNAAIYYFLDDASDKDIFAVDKLTGSIYTNRSLDYESQHQYSLIVKATNNASYTSQKRHKRSAHETLRYNDNDTSTAHVKVHVGDLNDNVPIFPDSSYVAGIPSNAKIGEIVGTITAFDPDQEDEATLMYSIEKTTLFSLGTRNSARVLDAPPFSIGKEGVVTTTAAMNLYNQDHFKLIIRSKESSPPGRSATTTLETWVYDTEQLVRVVLTQSVKNVHKLLPTIIRNLCNVTDGIAIVTDIRRQTNNDVKNHNSDWTQLAVLVIDDEKRVVKPVSDVLESISRNANYLNVQPEKYNIVEVLPFVGEEKPMSFDLALTTLVSLCIVLFIGLILIVIVFHCLKQWYKDKRIAIVKKREISEPPVTTENPLWIDTDSPTWVDPVSKPYEEQELSMHVLTDQEMQNRRKEAAANQTQPDVMYATVRRNGRSVRDNLSAMEANDGYATLNQDRTNTLDRSRNDHNGTLQSNRSGYHNGTLNGSGTMPRRQNVSPTPVVTVRAHQGIILAHEGEPFARTEVL